MDLIGGNILGLVPGVIFLIVATGLVVETLDERLVRRHVDAVRPRQTVTAEILQPLVEAA